MNLSNPVRFVVVVDGTDLAEFDTEAQASRWADECAPEGWTIRLV